MALETSGFQLSQFDRAPQIPGNIGVVDTKSIYGAVVDALKTNEALRTTQQVQAMNDAETALQRQTALGQLEQLPTTLEAQRAKNVLATQQAQADLGLIGAKTEAARTGAEAERVKNVLMSDKDFLQRTLENKMLSPATKTQIQLNKLLQDPNTPEDMKASIKVALKQSLTPKEQQTLDLARGKVHEAIVDGQVVQFRPDGSARILGVPGSEMGGFVSGQTLAPTTAVAPTGMPLSTAAAPTTVLSGTAPTFSSAGPLAAPVGLTAGRFGESKAQTRAAMQTEKQADSILRMNEKEYEDVRQRLEVSLPTDRRSLNTLKDNTANVEKALDEAAQIVGDYGYLATGPGESLRSKLPNPIRARFDALSEMIRANLGFDQLQAMRQNSKTGGALGNVSDVEGKRLESTFGSLNTTQAPEDMLKTIQGIKDARRNLVTRAEEAYTEAYNRAQSSLARVRPDLAPAAEAEAPAAEAPAAPASGLFPAAGSMAPRTFMAPEPARTSSIFPAAGSMAPRTFMASQTTATPEKPQALVPAEAAQAPSGFKVKAVDNQPIVVGNKYETVTPVSAPTPSQTAAPAAAPSNEPPSWYSSGRDPEANQRAVIEFFKRIPETSLRGIQLPAETVMGAANLVQKAGGEMARFFTPSNWKWAGNNALVFDPPQESPATTLPNLP